VHWDDYTPLLIAKPAPFLFDAVPRSWRKVAKMREMYHAARDPYNAVEQGDMDVGQFKDDLGKRRILGDRFADEETDKEVRLDPAIERVEAYYAAAEEAEAQEAAAEEAEAQEAEAQEAAAQEAVAQAAAAQEAAAQEAAAQDETTKDETTQDEVAQDADSEPDSEPDIPELEEQEPLVGEPAVRVTDWEPGLPQLGLLEPYCPEPYCHLPEPDLESDLSEPDLPELEEALVGVGGEGVKAWGPWTRTLTSRWAWGSGRSIWARDGSEQATLGHMQLGRPGLFLGPAFR
jgi:hypothetical protein